jgi:hypothetical protein
MPSRRPPQCPLPNTPAVAAARDSVRALSVVLSLLVSRPARWSLPGLSGEAASASIRGRTGWPRESMMLGRQKLDELVVVDP